MPFLIFLPGGLPSRSYQNRSYSICEDVSTSALRASAGILSGPGALLFLERMIAFLISALVGRLQSTDRGTSAGCMFALTAGDGWFSRCDKCSTHLFICSSCVFNVLPRLSLTGWFPLWYFLVRSRTLS